MAFQPDPPCNHRERFVGTVGAGDPTTGPHSSVATCRDCIAKSAEYVERRTGIPADPFVSYAEYRASKAES